MSICSSTVYSLKTKSLKTSSPNGYHGNHHGYHSNQELTRYLGVVIIIKTEQINNTIVYIYIYRIQMPAGARWLPTRQITGTKLTRELLKLPGNC